MYRWSKRTSAVRSDRTDTLDSDSLRRRRHQEHSHFQRPRHGRQRRTMDDRNRSQDRLEQIVQQRNVSRYEVWNCSARLSETACITGQGKERPTNMREFLSWAQTYYRIDVTASTEERKTGGLESAGACPGGCKEFSHKGSNARSISLACKICGTVRREEHHPHRQDPAACSHRQMDLRGSNAHTRKTYCVDCGTYIDSVPREINNALEATRSASSNRNEELADRISRDTTITTRQVDLATIMMLEQISRLSDGDYELR